jgi:uncharacterized membrane protein
MSSQVAVLSPTLSQVQTAARSRILPLDALRGLALVFMALDHAAAFVQAGLQAETYGGLPAFLQGPAYWVSGLLTNIAAPAFWCLAGVSVALLEASRRRAGESEGAITRFLLIRAGVLVVFSLTICDWFWAGTVVYMQVLLSLGLSLALLSVLCRLPNAVLLGLALTQVMVFQAALPWIAANFWQTSNYWAALLLGYTTVTYPASEFSLGGWLPLMMLGLLIGRNLQRPQLRQPGTWLAVGAGLLLVWFILRIWGQFGDLVPFATNESWSHFLIMSKEPPSLTFFTFNLGWAALALGLLYARSSWLEGWLGQWLVALGQAALFSFVAHIVIYNLVSRGVLWLNLPGPGIIRAYLAWLLGLLLLFPLARAYRDLRQRHPKSVLRYL